MIAALLARFWPHLLGAVIVCGVAGWVGHRWSAGAAAIETVERQEKDLAALRADLATAVEQIERDREAYRQAVAEVNALTESFSTITAGLAHASQQTDQQFRRLRSDMAAGFSARPDLDGLRVGPELLRVWNRANAGDSADAGAAGAAAGNPGASAGGMPAAGASDRRQPAGPSR